MFHTLAHYSTLLYRSFAQYTTGRLQELDLHYGALFLILYVGKHPGCTQAELTNALHLDWGHSQRSVTRLTEAGFLLREKNGRAYHLRLSEKGEQAFAVSHQVFFDWDAAHLSALTEEEQVQLFHLLSKLTQKEAILPPCTNCSSVRSTTAD